MASWELLRLVSALTGSAAAANWGMNAIGLASRRMGRGKKMTIKCALCPNTEELTTLDYPPIRVCRSCLEKLKTKIATICEGCSTIYWIPKTLENAMQAGYYHGADPRQVMENQTLFMIKTCRRCYDRVKEFMQTAAWVH